MVCLMWFRESFRRQSGDDEYVCEGCGALLEDPDVEQCPWCGYDPYGDGLLDQY